MHRGFTLVEIVIVVVVLTVLTSIGITGYTRYQSRAIDSGTRALASTVKAAAERYYATNQEYPVAAMLGGRTAGQIPADYQVAATILNVPAATLDNGSTKLIPCGYMGTINASGAQNYCFTYMEKGFVYYLTKMSQTETVQRQYTILGCTYTFPSTGAVASETGGRSFILMFWSIELNRWEIVRSERGGVSTSNSTTCPFRAP